MILGDVGFFLFFCFVCVCACVCVCVCVCVFLSRKSNVKSASYLSSVKKYMKRNFLISNTIVLVSCFLGGNRLHQKKRIILHTTMAFYEIRWQMFRNDNTMSHLFHNKIFMWIAIVMSG